MWVHPSVPGHHIFLISVCWLLLFFKTYTWTSVSDILRRQVRALPANWSFIAQLIVFKLFSWWRSCCAKTSTRQAFSTHCICPCCFSSLCVLLLEQTTTLPESLKNPSCRLCFFIPFHWVGCQNWFLVIYCNTLYSIAMGPSLPDQASAGQRTRWTQTCLQNLNADLLWETLWTTTQFFFLSENPVGILHLNQVLHKTPYVAHHNHDLHYSCISVSLRKDGMVCTELWEELKFVRILPLHEDAQGSITRTGLSLALRQHKTPLSRRKELMRCIIPQSN